MCKRFLASSSDSIFWLRVFNPTPKRFVNQRISKTYEVNEREKRKLYNERILQTEHGSFTPLVMSTTGGMGRECKKFYARLAIIISYKRVTSYSVIAAWVRRKIAFSLIKSVGMCLPGSRSVFYYDALEKSLSGDVHKWIYFEYINKHYFTDDFIFINIFYDM